jgi:hypothetical protein
MEVICLQDATFYSLIDKVTEHNKEKYSVKEDKWISDEEVMRKLLITRDDVTEIPRPRQNLFSQS